MREFLPFGGVLLSLASAGAAPRLSIVPIGGGQFELSWPTEEMRPYQLAGSADMVSWGCVGEVTLGTGEWETVVVEQSGPKYFFKLLEGAVREGFDGVVLPPNDDESYAGGGEEALEVPLGFSLNFYGETVTHCYVNNNGNITFDNALKQFTPSLLGTQDEKIIAPFWADVDTRGLNSGLVRFSSGGETVNGRPAFGVTYENVGYYNSMDDKLNTFQVVLIDRSDVSEGSFDIEFNYSRVLWETGSASEGMNGYGGKSARCGIANGEGLFFEYKGSGVVSAFLDTDPETGDPNFDSGLIYQQYNSLVPGRILIPVRDGEVESGFEVDAGPDVVLDEDAGSKFRLQGSAPEDVELEWTLVSASGDVAIDSEDQLDPEVTIPYPGYWEFKLTGVREGDLIVTANDTVVIEHPGILDVFAGGYYFNLEGDGTPVTHVFSKARVYFSSGEVPVSVQWSQEAGPPATIVDPGVVNAEVQLSQPGTYRFKLTGTTGHGAAEGAFQMSSTVELNYSLAVDAGADRVLDENAGSKIQLDGSVPSGVSVEWSLVNGSGDVEIVPVNALDPTVTIPYPGTWEFRLTGTLDSDPTVSASDTVRVEHPGEFEVDAGEDLVVTGDGTPVTEVFSGAEAVFSGMETVDVLWEQLSGPAATIADPTSVQAEVTLSAPGDYCFRLTGTTTHGASEGAFTMTDTVDVEYVAE